MPKRDASYYRAWHSKQRATKIARLTQGNSENVGTHANVDNSEGRRQGSRDRQLHRSVRQAPDENVHAQKEADAFHDRTKVDVRAGVHTPDSSSMTVAQAAEKWIRTCSDAGLERSTLESYEQNVKLHIEPFIRRMKLSQLTAPSVREFQDDLRSGKPAPGEDQGNVRSPAMVKKILNSLDSIISDAQERGLVARNVVRDLRSRRKVA